MGSGDLNMKKSWHPQRSGNVAATQKAEAEAIAERKKLQQRLQEIEEERRKEEIQKALEAAGGKRKIDRVEWMYSGPTDGQAGDAAENEAYLLGKRRIDKLLQDNETKKLQKNAGHDGPSSAGGMPALPPAANARDIATKIREDPLLAIKRQEQQAYEAVMNDPIKRRQLFASMGIDDPKSKSKPKDEKRQRHRHSDRSHRRRDGDRNRDGERSSRRRRSSSGSRSRSPRRRDEDDDRKRRRRDSPDRRRRRSESVESRDDDHEREGRRERHRSRERRDSRDRRSCSRDRRSDSRDRRERRNGREHERKERPKHDRPARESRSPSPPPRRRDALPERDGPPPRRHGRDGDRTSYDRRGHRENGDRERAPPDNGADEKAREEERARKLAAMQAAATDLDLDRERRLAAIEEAERAQCEADDRARQRNKRLGGDAGFVNQLHSRAAELKIADRVGRR